jgi:FkbM family methyltransferase
MRRLLRPATIDIEGVRINARSPLMPLSLRKAIYHADHEASERLAVQAMVRPGDRVLEGGAGIGLVTISAAKIAGSGQVVSYEPGPSSYAMLKENVAMNSVEVDCRNRALGPQAGALNFHVSDNLVGSRAAVGPSDGVMNVVVDGISDALTETSSNVLILDIEGGEVDLIDACPLDRLDRIIMEIHPKIVGYERTSRMIAKIINAGLVWRHDLSHGSVMSFQRIGPSTGGR